MKQNASAVNSGRNMVEKFWGETDYPASEHNFYHFPPIRSRSCSLIFGESDAGRSDWCEYWTVEKYLRDRIPFEKCLSICCGFGRVERTLAKLNVATHIVGTDIAPKAIEQAREKAAAEQIENIDYYVGDLNTDVLPENEYDLIWANGGLHHIARLDLVVPKLKQALRPNGMLIANEYVGPKYQQLPPRQQEIANAVKHLLPRELRDNTNYYRLGKLREYQQGRSLRARIAGRLVRYCEQLTEYAVPARFGQIWQMSSVENFLAYDPSESVGADRVIPELKKNFPRVEVKNYKGSIVLYVLDRFFYENFDVRNDSHRRLLETLFTIEDTFIESGELQSDNAHIICSC
ncbi:MAG: class I SAM-dependent methyltransferase [bacterium]